MIKLEIEEYCDGCDGFVPVAYRNPLKPQLVYGPLPVEIVVRCETSRKCKRMYEHIKRHCEDPVDCCVVRQMTIDDYINSARDEFLNNLGM